VTPASDVLPLASGPSLRLPSWIRMRPPEGPGYPEVRGLLAELELGTVCREARCPNLSECWSAGTATLMLLGTDCSRRCGFCAVRTHWSGGMVDPTEPGRVAEAVERWGLRYVVLTQVCRDDLPDGGARHLSDTVRRIRAVSPGTRVELLIGDLAGNPEAVDTILEAAPDVVAHNLETVPRLSPSVRDRRASYERSLEVLRRAKRSAPSPPVTKSSIMLGLGESEAELHEAFRALREAGTDLLTLGQYLRPTLEHLPVARYVTPEEFVHLRDVALDFGFAGVASGPMVRSSYHADELFRAARPSMEA
jgi:lipoyl synthase